MSAWYSGEVYLDFVQMTGQPRSAINFTSCWPGSHATATADYFNTAVTAIMDLVSTCPSKTCIDPGNGEVHAVIEQPDCGSNAQASSDVLQVASHVVDQWHTSLVTELPGGRASHLLTSSLMSGVPQAIKLQPINSKESCPRSEKLLFQEPILLPMG